MSDYYKEADGVVLLSFSEGFGLSLVEGMHFGVPCAMFSDMDAFEDIYDEHAVVELNTRDTQTVSTQITFLLTKDWDRNAIREYANKFSSETMANHYLIVYKNILQ
jgi:glycosyltransferase involved in cell wall biosynthesis